MAIPEASRVLYQKSPLEEVTCQLRFPPILSISSTSPAQFQDEIRELFPYYQHQATVKLPAGTPQALTQLVTHDLALGGTAAHTFESEDRCWAIKLSRDGLSLICRRYDRWETFRERLQLALDPLSRIYRPAFFLHTCVRYKNSIRRSVLGLAASVPWSVLIQSWAAGPLGQSETELDVELMQTRCVVRLPNKLGRIDATCSLGKHAPSDEQAFLIEAHVFNEERKELARVLPYLDSLNQQARFFFRHCITDELHRAMGPVDATPG